MQLNNTCVAITQQPRRPPGNYPSKLSDLRPVSSSAAARRHNGALYFAAAFLRQSGIIILYDVFMSTPIFR